ncbi:hypothetical protein IV417_11550 [Alphaproteobacteria bacterium KMM 3653]|uniref:Thiol:disulfide interchange protein DsbD N-terminal domain-containing protein n=2 Tax=Harenicola maris TaxID=2841044 RepID=A0AAP2CRS3_9RHOB|nr:hypothetical protein [Harenicola maris]
MINAARTLCRLLASACLVAAGALPAAAQSTMPDVDDIIKAEVLTGWQTRTGTHMAALRLTLMPGWKTYWRSPGAAGIPPQFNWSGSGNLKALEVHWPAPEVFLTAGARTLGYSKQVVLPVEITPSQKGQTIRLRGEINLGVCEEICIPATVNVDAQIAGKGASDPAIHGALARRPVAASKAGVGTVTCSVTPISDGVQMTTRIPMAQLGNREIAVIEAGNPEVWVSQPEVHREGNTLVATADFVPPRRGAYMLDRSAVRITVLSGPMAIDIAGCQGS